MADVNVLRPGQYYALEISDDGSPETWALIACLNQKGFTIANKVIDGTSDCGPNFAAGFANSTAKATGFEAFQDPEDRFTAPSLFDLAQSKESRTFRFYPIGTDANPAATGDSIYTFTGFVSNYDDNMSTDENIGFDVSWQVQGNIERTTLP